MAVKKKVEKTKEKVTQVFNQALNSLKLLEALEKNTMEKARNLVKIPKSAVRKQMTNDKILASLKRLGVATQADLDHLQAKIDRLEAQIAGKATRKKSEEIETDSVPQA